MTDLVRKRVNQLNVIGDIQDGDVLVGERITGTTVRITYRESGVIDGDKGDITVSNSGVDWTINTPALVTVSTNDKVLIKDSLDTFKHITVQDILDLATGGVSSVNGETGNVILTTDDISDTAQTHKFVTSTDLTKLSNLSGINTGDQTSIVGITGTKAQFDTAVTDGNFLYSGDVTQYTDEMAQDAVGNMIDSSLVYIDATLQRAALTGDVTASAGSNTTTIANDAVTYAKMQNISATDRLLGRSSSGAGDIEEIVCTAAGRALIDDVDTATQRTTLGLGSLATQSGTFSGTSSGTNTGDQTITLTGEVTGSGTGSFAATIASGAVTLSKMANVATSTVFYRKTAGSGSPEVNTLATLKTDLGAALTKTDDTNVTLTLGGAPTTALLQATSLTLGWTGQLAETRGGTGQSSISQGDMLYGSANNTISKLAKATSGTQFISNQGIGNNPSWKSFDYSTDGGGLLGVTNGGTSQYTYTTGDVLYASATNTLSKLGIGTTGSRLTVASGVPTWKGGNTAFFAYRSTAQSISNATYTKVQLNVEDFDTGSYFDSSTNYRYTPLVAGRYLFVGQVFFELTSMPAGTIVIANIYKNGNPIMESWSYTVVANTFTSANILTFIDLNGSTDYVELYCYQGSGGSRNLLASASTVRYNFFSGILMEPV